MFMVYVFTRVLRFPDNTVIARIKDNYHEQGNIIITNLLLPLGHISNTIGISESVCWVGTNRDWDLSLRMTERYLWAHTVMHHHNELNVTKWLLTGSCITVRVK